MFPWEIQLRGMLVCLYVMLMFVYWVPLPTGYTSITRMMGDVYAHNFISV